MTYNANKSYNIMVIGCKPQDMKTIHCVNLNNHPLLRNVNILII